MSNAVKQVKVLMSDEAKQNQVELEAIKRQTLELRERAKALKEQTKGMTICRFEYVDKKTQQVRSGVELRGLSMRSHSFFAEQLLRLVGNTPEAEANRQAICDFIETNKETLSWKK